MTLHTDDIGVWNNLGTLTPVPDQWIKFPVISNGANALFRVTFFALNFAKVRSYLLLRESYSTAQTSQVTEARRVYVRQEQQLLEIPVPKDLFDRTIYLRYLEAKKVYFRPRGLGITYDLDWQVKLEEIWG